MSCTLMLALVGACCMAAVSLVDSSAVAALLVLLALGLSIGFAYLASRRLALNYAPDPDQLAFLAREGQSSPDIAGLMQLAAQGVSYNKAFHASDSALLLVDSEGRVRQASVGFMRLTADHGPWLAQTYPGFACDDPAGVAINGFIGEAGLPAQREASLSLSGGEGTTIRVAIRPLGASAQARCWLVEFTPRPAPQACFAEAIEALLFGSLASEHTKGMSERQKQAIMTLKDELERGRDMAEETAQVITALADGNLAVRISRRGGGQTLSALTLVNSAIDRLANILRTLREGAEKIKVSTTDVSDGARIIAERTVQQAQSLVQTSTAMGQIANAAQAACEHADKASKLATTARQSATSGGTIAASAIDAMGKIEESSSRITQIVGLIDDIAFQTNLLALNAAVEAARAGDAGKGFAVVATEVRSLAQRTGQASREIKDLIVNSRSSVSTGVDLVRATDEELSKIEGVIAELDQVMTKVAVASRQQAAGISEVAGAISEMDRITQQNATLVDKTMTALGGTQSQIDAFQSIMRNERAASAASSPQQGRTFSASALPAPASRFDRGATPPANVAAPHAAERFAASASRTAFSSASRRTSVAAAPADVNAAPSMDARRMQDALNRNFPHNVSNDSRTPLSRSRTMDQYGSAAQSLLMHDDEWNEF